MNCVADLKNNQRKVDYPAERAPYSNRRKSFPWRRTEAGCKALLVMHCWVESHGGLAAIAVSRDYAKRFISPATLQEVVRKHVPELPQVYAAHTGAEFTPELLVKRVYMWNLQHLGKGQGCQPKPSREWPPNWATGDQITNVNAEMRHAGTIP